MGLVVVGVAGVNGLVGVGEGGVMDTVVGVCVGTFGNDMFSLDY